MLMKIKKITIDPDPYEPFRLAQGYRVGELLFISGQAAIDASGQLVGVGNFDVQAEQVFANLERVLRAGGSSLANVIKVTIFLRDMSNFPKIVELAGSLLHASVSGRHDRRGHVPLLPRGADRD